MNTQLTSGQSRLGRCVYIVDDDDLVRDALSSLLRSMSLEVHAFSTTQEYLACAKANGPACLVLDVRLKGESGLAFQRALVGSGQPSIPIIFMTGHGDIAMTVCAMKAGALDFLAKPFRDQEMIDAVFNALDCDERRREVRQAAEETRLGWEALTPRERDVTRLVATGLMNKQIAAELGIAEITTKIHRGQAMRKLNVRSVAQLVRRLEALGLLEPA